MNVIFKSVSMSEPSFLLFRDDSILYSFEKATILHLSVNKKRKRNLKM